MIGRLSRHGLSAVIVGVESVREKDLKDFNKRSSLENNEKAIRILQKYGIELYATMILQPDFTQKDFKCVGKWVKNDGKRAIAVLSGFHYNIQSVLRLGVAGNSAAVSCVKNKREAVCLI